MAAATSSHNTGDITCPDPSAHEHQNQLSADASKAALLAAQGDTNSRSASQRDSPLGSNGRLTARGQASSLKYANAQDLPSFPSRGGNASAASAAALLAQDHKMKDLWYPETSAAGSKAAMLAARDGGKVDLWRPSPTSAGNSAASLAMKNKSLSPQVDRGYTDAGRTNSMLAATKSAQLGRQRAGSTPIAPAKTYPDQQNSGKNALNAATVSHRASTRNTGDGWNSDANQAARVKNMHMDREMFGEHPPVEPEVAEQKHQAALRASAVVMAKQMMEHQNRNKEPTESETSSVRLGSAGADTAHRRNQSSTSQADLKEEAMKYIHLQDAAHRLAQERLAKVEKDMEHDKYREHYGYGSPKSSRFSVRGRGRKRASSEGQSLDSDDEAQARRIRTQMSQLSTAQRAVDDKQRTDDRARLMAAAEKRVHAQMHDMDEKVFQDTGKVSQSMMDEWEAKALERAERDRAERAQHPGQTHIGGGKYMAQADIEAIAAARLKPTLDELTDTAEKKRARDEAVRAELDRQETARMEEKIKSDHVKAEFKRIKEQDKAAARKEKEDRKAAKRAEKEAERAKKAEEKRKSREQNRDVLAASAGGAALAGIVDEKKKEEWESKKDQMATGDALLEALDKSKEEDEEQKKDQAAVGDTLKEVAERVKSHEDAEDESELSEDDEEEDRGRDIAPVAATAAAVPVFARVAAAAAPEEEETKAEPIEPKEEIKEQPAAETKEQSREVAKEQPKEKPERRSVFGTIKDRFKRKDKEEKAEQKPAEEPKKSVEPVAVVAEEEEPEKSAEPAPVATEEDTEKSIESTPVVEEEKAEEEKPKQSFEAPVFTEEEARNTYEEAHKSDDDAVAPVATAGASGVNGEDHIDSEDGKRSIDGSAAAAAASGGVEEKQAAREEEATKPDEAKDDDDSIDKVQMAGAVAGTAALGAVVAAGSVEEEHRQMDEREEHLADVSSLSSTDDELSDSDDDRDLEGVTTAAEHSGAYNLAGPSPGVEKRPDIMRHISTIQYSSESEPESEPELADTDADEERGRGRPTLEQDYLEREGVSTRDTPLVTEHVPSAVHEEPESPVSPLERDEEDPAEDGKFVMGSKDAAPEEPQREIAPAESASVDESAAPSPVVKSAPSREESKPEKKEGGVRGFFRKLKNKSKADNKLTKRQHSSASEHSLPGAGAAATEEKEPEPEPAAESKDEDFITPATTTHAGAEAETRHMGIDGPIGDAKHVSGLGGDPRPASPSSFTRGEAASRDLDDVSSSGADEEDVSRGRAGRILDKIGLKGKGKEKEDEVPLSATSNGDEDHFEEARDQFDESLAPPPAFGGQLKSGSPVRETRFQEQL